MNIDINILPAELRPKALIDTKTFALIVVILLLGVGCFYFFHAKSSSQADIANMQSQTKTMLQKTVALSSNQDALKLIDSINQLKATKQSYDAFVASRVLVGKAFSRVYDLVPVGVSVSSISERGDTLVIAGSALSYTDASLYGRALNNNNDPKFTLVGLPSFSGGAFSLTVSVTPGGG
jgi:Tfp pilus assembly protein PilN